MVTPWHSKADAARHSAEVEHQLDLIDYIDSMAVGKVTARQGNLTFVYWPKDRLEQASFHRVQPYRQVRRQGASDG
jgi:hypothetical protein